MHDNRGVELRSFVCPFTLGNVKLADHVIC